MHVWPSGGEGFFDRGERGRGEGGRGGLGQKYEGGGSPTLVFATADEVQIGRVRTYLMPQSFLERMRTINESWPKLRLLISSLKDDPDQGTTAAEVGDMYWERDVPRDARPYYNQAIQVLRAKGALAESEKRALIRSCIKLTEISCNISGTVDANEVRTWIAVAKQTDPQNTLGLLDDALAWDAMVRYYILKDHAGALATARGVMEKFPDSDAGDVALYAMAAGQSATGQKDEAIKSLDALVEKFPRSRYLERSINFLEKLGKKMRE